MEDEDVCRICGKAIKNEEGRIIEHGGLLSQAHPVCYWKERMRVEEPEKSQDDEGPT